MLCYGARASVVGARPPSLQVGSYATPGAGLARGFHDVLRERPWDDALSAWGEEPALQQQYCSLRDG